MRTVGKVIGGVVLFLVVIGVLKGAGEADFTGGQSIAEIAGTIINAVADLTVMLIPTIIGAVSGFAGG